MISGIVMYSKGDFELFIKIFTCPMFVMCDSHSSACTVYCKGGSWVSTGDEASRFARYSFRRHFFQHLGFRMVRSVSPPPVRLCKAEVFILGAGVTGKCSIAVSLALYIRWRPLFPHR